MHRFFCLIHFSAYPFPSFSIGWIRRWANHSTFCCLLESFLLRSNLIFFSFVAPSGPPRDVLVIPRAKNTIRVSWSIPSAQDCNGIITKYEIILYKQNGLTQTYPRKGKTLYQDISGLELNQRYIIGVRACTKVGPGPYSRNHSYSTGNTNERGANVFPFIWTFACCF